MTSRRIALGIGIAITIAIVVVLLTQHGITMRIPWIEKKHVVWRNVEFITTELRFGVNYTMICTIHKGPNYYCIDRALKENAAYPGSVYRIIGCVKYPAEIGIGSRCSGIKLNLPGCYNVTLYVHKNYDVYIIIYKNSTGVYKYVYKIKCGYTTESELMKTFNPVSGPPDKDLIVTLDVPTFKIDLRHNRIIKVNYTSTYGWFIVYKIR